MKRANLNWIGKGVLIGLAGAMLAVEEASAAEFKFKEVSDKSLGLWEGDQPVFVYNHGLISSENAPKAKARSTYLHPIYGLDGEVISGDFEKDHDYHRGLFWGWPHIKIGEKEYDLWSLRGVEQRFQRWIERDTKSPAVLAVQNGWHTGEKEVMREEVRIRVHPREQHTRSIDFEFRWTPKEELITIWGAPGKSYGGFTFRFGPRTQTLITAPSGLTSEDLVMTKLAWADFTADFAGPEKFSGGAVFVHPAHPGYPPTWMTRHYGVLAVGWPGVTPQTLEAGKAVVCRYRVLIHKGKLGAEEIAKAYDSYQKSAGR